MGFHCLISTYTFFISITGGSIGPFGNKASIGKHVCKHLSLVEVDLDFFTIGLVLEIVDYLYLTEKLSLDKIAAYVGELGHLSGNPGTIRKTISNAKSVLKKIKKTERNREQNIIRQLSSPFPGSTRRDPSSPRKRKLKEDLNDAKRKNAKLREEKRNTEKKLERAEKLKMEAKTREMENHQMKEEAKQLRKNISELEKMQRDVDKNLVNAEKRIDELISQFEPLENDLDDYKNNYKENARALENSQKQYGTVSEKLEKTSKKLASFSTRNVNKRVWSRESTILELQKDKQGLVDQVEKQEADITDLQRKLQIADMAKQQEGVSRKGVEESLNQVRKDKKRIYKHGWYMDKKEENRKEKQGPRTFNEEYVKDLRIKMNLLDQRNRELEQLFVLLESEEIETFHDGKYDDEVREVVMDLLCMNVGMNKVNKVIRTVLNKLANKDIGRLPSNHIKSNILMEARFLADLEVAEAMKEGVTMDNVLGNAIHGDGTTKFHKKYQNFQVTLNDGTQRTFACQPMASGTTDAVIACFENRVGELADALHVAKGDSAKQHYATLIASIKSTMTDQGPGMPQFSEKLQSIRSHLLPVAYQKWDELPSEVKDTTKEFCTFYCKMHPLINFATECDKVLKGFEDVATSGKNVHTFLTAEAGVTRLVRTSSKAFHRRGCDKSGVEEFFTPYVQKQFDSKNHLVHYIGNRANILFEGAAAAFYHLHHMDSFLQLLPDPNQLLKAVQEDLEEPIFVAELLALGIIHKIITAPFWHIIKTSPNVLSMNPTLRKLQLALQKFSEDATPLFEGTPVFDDEVAPIIKDDIYECLFEVAHNPARETMCIQALELLCISMLLILERQCEDQLPGGIYWEEDVEKWSNVPATNMVGERDFAVLDLLVRQKPAARTTSLEALIMWGHNKTSSWLATLDHQTKTKYMTEARMRSGTLIKRYHTRMGEIRQKKWETLQAKHKEKKEKETRQIGQALKLAKGVESSPGGLWTTPDEVEMNLRQVPDKQQIETLHQQLTFLKTNLKCKGPKEYFTKSHHQKKYSITEMKSHLIAVLTLNNIPDLAAQADQQGTAERPISYISAHERKEAHAAQKATLAAKIKENRRKRAIATSKDKLKSYLEDPTLLVGKSVLHRCREEGQAPSEAEWYTADVGGISKQKKDADIIKTLYCTTYEDESSYDMPLLMDLKNNDLIITT